MIRSVKNSVCPFLLSVCDVKKMDEKKIKIDVSATSASFITEVILIIHVPNGDEMCE